jgi:O6-methylguanine-DNA--protein-cysteine methyltransferase
MTAKEQLRERVERLTEDEAAETLRLLDQRNDALTRLLDDAPLDDEPTTPEEEAAVQEALEAAARGETITLEELRAELDAEPR